MDIKKKPLNSLLIKPAGPDCNLDCTYCFYSEKKDLFPETRIHRMSEEIHAELIRQVMDQPQKEISLAWQGGEPTLMGLKFFQRSVELQQRYAADRRVGNGLQTNGLMIDDEWARFLYQHDFLVGLSIDGPRHVHDRYRVMENGKGTWTKTVAAAKRMLDRGVAVNAVTVVNDYSAEFPEEIYAFHKAMGLNHMQFIPCLETDRDHPNAVAPFSVSAEQYGRFLCIVFDLWLLDFEDGIPGTFIRFFDALFYRYVGMHPPECTLLEECGDYVVVEHNGDVYACDFFVEPRWKLGNIMEASLPEMLNSPKQEAFGKRKTSLSAECVHCEWLALCRGGCPKDRIDDGGGRLMNHFCRAYQIFLRHADEPLRKLAAVWLHRDRRGES